MALLFFSGTDASDPAPDAHGAGLHVAVSKDSLLLLLWSDREVIAARFFGSGVQIASRGRQRRMTERLAHSGEVRAAA